MRVNIWKGFIELAGSVRYSRGRYHGRGFSQADAREGKIRVDGESVNVDFNNS